MSYKSIGSQGSQQKQNSEHLTINQQDKQNSDILFQSDKKLHQNPSSTYQLGLDDITPQAQKQKCLTEDPQLEYLNSDCDDNENTPEIQLKKFKSHQQLKQQFEQNGKIIQGLSSNISDLFKKISSLTEEVTNQIQILPIENIKSVQDCFLSANKWKSQSLIPDFNKQNDTENKCIQFAGSLRMLPDQSEQEIIGLQMKLFETGKRLGYGKYGEVISCRHKETGGIYALKKIFKSTIQKYQMQQQLFTQLIACSKMDHPNIMKSYAAFTDEFHIFLLSEYLAGQRLTKKFNSSEEEVSKIIVQVLHAIQYMHNIGVVHRDLKPENIIINKSGVIKICDFGWSNLIDKQPQMRILCGTLDYVCPEMVCNQKYHKQVDLWSVGILIYQLIYGIAPFKQSDRQSTFDRAKNIDLQIPSEPKISNFCQDFLQKLLKPQQQRMKLQQCLNHEFIKRYQSPKQEQKFSCQQFDNLFE